MTLMGFLYSFVRRNAPVDDVRSEAFTTFGLIPEAPVGAGIANATQFQLTIPLAWQLPGVVINGLGGLQHGQFIGQPLVAYNPANSTPVFTGAGA